MKFVRFLNGLGVLCFTTFASLYPIHFSAAQESGFFVEIPLGERSSQRWLREGWSVPEEGRRWSSGLRSRIEFNAPRRAHIILRFECEPFQFTGAPEQKLTVLLNGRPMAELTLPPGLRSYRVMLPESRVRLGVNLIDFIYAYTRRPVDTVRGSTDPRSVAVRWHSLQMAERGVSGARVALPPPHRAAPQRQPEKPGAVAAPAPAARPETATGPGGRAPISKALPKTPGPEPPRVSKSVPPARVPARPAEPPQPKGAKTATLPAGPTSSQGGASGGEKRLAHTKQETVYSLAKDRSGCEVISTSRGESVRVVRPNGLQGYLDAVFSRGNYIVFKGWAADTRRQSQAAQSIVFFANGKHVFTGEAKAERPDVATYHKNPHLERSGFFFGFPSQLFANRADLEIRVFVVAEKGLATELQYPKGYPWIRAVTVACQ